MNLTKKQKESTNLLLTDVLNKTDRSDEVQLVPYIFSSENTSVGAFGFGAELAAGLVLPVLFKFIVGLASEGTSEFAKKFGEQIAGALWSREKEVNIQPEMLVKLRDSFVQRLEVEGINNSDACRAGDALVSVIVEKQPLLRSIVNPGA